MTRDGAFAGGLVLEIRITGVHHAVIQLGAGLHLSVAAFSASDLSLSHHFRLMGIQHTGVETRLSTAGMVECPETAPKSVPFTLLLRF